MPRPLLVADFAARAPASIASDRSLAEAHRLMNTWRVRHLPVLDAAKLVGVVSQRDLYFMETIQGVDPDEVPIEEAMNHEPYVVDVETPLRSAVQHMWKHKLDAAVVLEDQRVVAIFTTTDALAALVQLLGPKSSHPDKPRERRPAR